MDTEQSQKETLKLPNIDNKNADIKNVTGSQSTGNIDQQKDNAKIISSEFKLGENLNKNSSRGSILSDAEVKVKEKSGTGHQNTSLNSGRASRFKKIDFVKLNMKAGK